MGESQDYNVSDYIETCLGIRHLDMDRVSDGFDPVIPHGEVAGNDCRVNIKYDDLDDLLKNGDSADQVLTALADKADSTEYNHFVVPYIRKGNKNHMRLKIHFKSGSDVEHVGDFRVVDLLFGDENQFIDYKLILSE